MLHMATSHLLYLDCQWSGALPDILVLSVVLKEVLIEAMVCRQSLSLHILFQQCHGAACE